MRKFEFSKHYVCLEGEKTAFSFTLSVLAIFLYFSPIQKHYKIVVARELGKTKSDTFKNVFGMGKKVAATNCVFQKLCSAENTVLLCFQQAQQLQQIMCMLNKQKIYENIGLLFNMAKGVFSLGVLLLVWRVVVGCVVFVCFLFIF